MSEPTVMGPTDRWWIWDPRGHREAQRHARGDVEVRPVVVDLGGIIAVGLAVGEIGDEWLCGGCGGPVPVEGSRGQALLVPMIGGLALCPPCVFRRLTPAQLAAVETEAWVPSMWSEKVCVCVACMAAETVYSASVAIEGEEG